MWIDKLATCGSIFDRKQTVIRNLDEVHVAEKFFAVGHGQLHGLNVYVDKVCAIVPQSFQVVALENVQREKLRGTLTGGGVLVDLVAAVVDENRRLHLGRILSEVVVTEQAAVRL